MKKAKVAPETRPSPAPAGICPDGIREASRFIQESRRGAKDLFDIAGKRFGRLTVIARVPERRSDVFVHCDCGAEKIVRLGNLITGNTRSCGCWKRQRNSLIHETIDARPEFITDPEFAEKNPVFRVDRDGDGILPMPKKKWKAFIGTGDKALELGIFDSQEAALEARRRAVDEILSSVIELKASSTAEVM